MKALHFLIVAFVLVIAWPFLAGGQNKVWKGNVLTEGDIRVVKNPSEPYYGELTFNLEENLLFGNVKDDNYFFAEIRTVRVDSQGHIYVLDTKNSRVQVYNSAGKYVRSIGRKGQGPGEFQRPVGIEFDRPGNLCILDTYRIMKFFNPEGTFMKNRIMQKMIQPAFFISPQGEIFSIEATGGPIRVVKLGVDGAEISLLATLGQVDRNTNLPAFCSMGSDAFCFGNSGEYKVYVSDQTGKVKLIIEKADKQAPFFEDILSDSMGRIYVLRVPSNPENAKSNVFDVFSEEGYYLYRTNLPFIPKVITKGSIYEARNDTETGEARVARYRVKNWASIKNSLN